MSESGKVTVKYLLLLILLATPFISLGQRRESSAKAKVSTVPEIPTVDFCVLLDNPTMYNQKVVRTRAVFSRGGEDFAALYCPTCHSTGRMVWPEFDDSFDTSTRSDVRKKFAKNFDVTLSATIVGKLINEPGGRVGAYRYQFLIMSAERAEKISTVMGLPDRLPEKARRRIRCQGEA